MGTVPILRTWSVGEIATAAELNSNVRDSINFLLATPRIVLTSSVSTNVTGTHTPATFAFNSEVIDTDTMHTGSNAFATCNTPGLFDVFFQVHYPALTGQGQNHYVFCAFQVNSSSWGGGSFITQDLRCMSTVSGFGTSCFVGQDLPLNAGDQVWFFVAQTTTSTLTIPSGQFGSQATLQWVAES